MSSVLQVENINVYYGSIHAVKDVSFHVEQGEVVTLIGANGAGIESGKIKMTNPDKPKSTKQLFYSE